MNKLGIVLLSLMFSLIVPFAAMADKAACSMDKGAKACTKGGCAEHGMGCKGHDMKGEGMGHGMKGEMMEGEGREGFVKMKMATKCYLMHAKELKLTHAILGLLLCSPSCARTISRTRRC